MSAVFLICEDNFNYLKVEEVMFKLGNYYYGCMELREHWTGKDLIDL